MNTLLSIAKAIVGAVVAALGTLSGLLVNDTSIGDITAGQWVTVAIAFFVALGAIWVVPNKEEAPSP